MPVLPCPPRSARSSALLAFLAVLAAVALVTGTGCDRLRTGEAASAHARYGRSLGDAGAAWRAAADSALVRAEPLATPERLRATLDTASADDGVRAWRLPVARGRVLVVAVRADSSVFVDVFRPARSDGSEGPGTARPAWVDGLATTPGRGDADAGGDTLRLEATAADTVVVRVHARRGHAVAVDVAVSTNPALAFPVAGVSESAIQSRFGVDRDGGARRHEGIDIFAPRGTPDVATSDGVASPGENRLGGTVVWLRDLDRGVSLYYAHLDTALVVPGQRVSRGDTLGRVGTTGNARSTPPHLHFGLYDRGAVDPYPFVAR